MSGEGDAVDAYFAAVNAENWEAMRRLWHPDGELLAAGARPRHGRAEILAYYPKVLSGYAEHDDRPGRRISEGNTVVVEIAFTGCTRQGQTVTFDAIDVFDLAGDRIRALSTWYDTAAVARQVRGG
jgi:ketosteroid isomerase-like protein